MILAGIRPRGFAGRGDKYLGDIARDLRMLILRIQDDFEDSDCLLDEDEASELAVVLAEFAEDVHVDVGLWRTVETHNRQCFGTPLPFFVEAGIVFWQLR